MRNILKYSLCYLLAIVIILYVLTINEGMENFGISSYNFLKSLEYFSFWVIPYWWLVLIIVSVVLSLITSGILKLVRKRTL